MAARSIWKGFLSFSLVSVPVKLYSASVSGGGGITLNQIHKDCNNRVQYKKFCPVHGELTSDAIVSGYQYDEGKYVLIDPDEVDKLRSPKDKAINVEAFVSPEQIDPANFNGKTYYLAPDGPMAFKPYALMHRVMVESGKAAFARFAWKGRDQMVLVRPVENLLAMVGLSYDNEVRKASEFTGEVPKVEVSPDELKLAKTLTDSLTEDEFDLSKYRDSFNDNLQKLVESKISGKQTIEAPAEAAPQVINLMEALQKSIAAAKKSAAASPNKKKPPKLVVPSSTGEAKAGRKRKTS